MSSLRWKSYDDMRHAAAKGLHDAIVDNKDTVHVEKLLDMFLVESVKILMGDAFKKYIKR